MTSNNDVIPEDGLAKIRLTNKTGLSLRPPEDGGVDRNEGDDDNYFCEGSTFLSVNRGEAHQRDETKTEKRERKTAMRWKRKVCRMQKKMMKEAFAEELKKRGHDVVVDPVGGKRYSDSREDGVWGKWWRARWHGWEFACPSGSN